jgi:hypothetical protein
MKNLSLLVKGSGSAVDKVHEPEVVICGALRFNGLGEARTESPWGFLTTFGLLPAATVAAGSEKYLVSLGTSTEVIARASKGGCNVKTQASTPADNDNAMLIGIANTASSIPMSAKSLIRWAARVSLTQITQLQFGAGLDENITTPIGSATAGDGAQFLFDPTDELGLVSSKTMVAANFILATKIDGADEYIDSGVKVVSGVDYELEIQVGADLKAKYYINGVLVGTSVTALTSGDTVSTVVGVQCSGTPDTQKDFDVRYLSMERQIG